jgi:hypothetical protein
MQSQASHHARNVHPDLVAVAERGDDDVVLKLHGIPTEGREGGRKEGRKKEDKQ